MTAEPPKIPIRAVNIADAHDAVWKIGIMVGLGGAAPRLYELDTGGGGFWAASGRKGMDGWGAFEEIPGTSLNIEYTSGNHYEAGVVKTTVEFYDLDHHRALFKTPPVYLSRIHTFQNSKKEKATAAWQTALQQGRPPLFGHFYGDFGLSPKSNPANATGFETGAFHVLGQIPHQAGSHSGYIVHIAGLLNRSPSYLQIGYTDKDKASFPLQFRMVLGKAKFPITGLSTYSSHLLADIEVVQGSHHKSFQNIPIVVDTGAPHAAIHQGELISVGKEFLSAESNEKGRRSDEFHAGKLLPQGAIVRLKGRDSVGGSEGVISLQAKSSPHIETVSVGAPHAKEGKDGSRFNTGLVIFLEYDVLFDLENGAIGFRKQRK